MRHKKIFTTFLSLTLVAGMLAGCSTKKQNEEIKDSNKKTVYTSFYPIYDFTKKIAGDKLNVINIVPVGSEPHDYELTVNDRKKLEKSDAIIYNGAGMEEWVDDLKDAMKKSNALFVDTSEGIKVEKGHGEDEHDKSDKHSHEHEFDPHIWLSPVNAKKQLENIKNAIVKMDSENKDYYESNYKKYSEEFDKLDKEYKEELKPFKDKSIVVSHEAFGYICKAYGIKQLGIEGLSPESEPSPSKMSEIVDFVKKNNIKVIFFEELVSPKVAEAIAKEASVKVEMLNPLEGLSDEDIKAGKDYISVMRDNLKSIVNSFK